MTVSPSGGRSGSPKDVGVDKAVVPADPGHRRRLTYGPICHALSVLTSSAAEVTPNLPRIELICVETVDGLMPKWWLMNLLECPFDMSSAIWASRCVSKRVGFATGANCAKMKARPVL